MTAAALTLALAVLVAPTRNRRLAGPRADVRAGSLRMPIVVLATALSVAGLMVAPPTVMIAVGVVAGTAGLRHRRRVRRRDRTSEAAALQAAMDVLVGELRVGAHPVAAFGNAAAEVDGVVATAMRAVAARARLGADVAAGLRSVGARSALPTHWERIAVCWQLAETHGLAIGTLMRTVQHDIVARERFSSKVNSGMAGARATATLLAVLPAAGIGLGQLIGAEPVRFLVAGGVGGWLLVIGVILVCGGLLWSDRITRAVLA